MSDKLVKLRELAEKTAAILHQCNYCATSCPIMDSCKRDRAYIADMIEQEVGTPLLVLLDSAEGRVTDHHAHDRSRDARTPQESYEFVNSDHPCCLPIGDVAQILEAWRAVESRASRAEQALRKIDAIRNSIIGFQKINWSEHIYPLVAALKEAGYEGDGHEIAAKNCGTLVEKLTAAETSLSSERERVIELEEALRTIAAWPFDIMGDCVADAKNLALRTLSVKPVETTKEECQP